MGAPFSGADLSRARRETPGCEEVLHFNNAGASLMPEPEILAAVIDEFTQTTKGNIARITETGNTIEITEGKVVRNSEPFGITVAPNGDPWYTMLEANKIVTLQSR